MPIQTNNNAARLWVQIVITIATVIVTSLTTAFTIAREIEKDTRAFTEQRIAALRDEVAREYAPLPEFRALCERVAERR